MVIWCLIVSRHARRSPLLPPRSLRVRHLAPFSFLFFNFRLSTFNFGLSSSRNSFPHNSLSDPQPLNPVLSILYKKGGGWATGEVWESRPRRESVCFSFLSVRLCSVTSFLQIPKRTTMSQPKPSVSVSQCQHVT